MAELVFDESEVQVVKFIAITACVAIGCFAACEATKSSDIESRLAAIETRLDQTELVVSALRDYLERHPVDSTPAGDPRPTLERPDER